MANIPAHIVDDIMQASRIEEVIGEFVSLKRAGSNLKGLSPFTDEKTASFVVSPAKQIFKCFSTGKGGTVVTFLMEKEHFSYPEALKWLANKYQIELPEERAPTQEELDKASEIESLYIINEFAKNHFSHNLWEETEGKSIGLSYFLERGFSKDTIEKFQLGYCMQSGQDFTQTALTKGYRKEYLEKLGLVKSKDDRQFDFFSGRVLFPIHSVSGRVLGFGGRTLSSDKKVAKYFNSPESIIYNKSEILYGLHYSKGDIIKYNNCFLCEGYTDVISMFQAGVKNVVSSSGTSLTKQQIKLIQRYTQNITILYDGDAPGIKASFRGIDLILEEGMNVKVVLFPDGEDPDSFAKANTQADLESYIEEHTQDFVSFKSDMLLSDTKNDPVKRSTVIKDILHSVSLIPDQITRTVYAKDLQERFQIEETVIQLELARLRNETVASQNILDSRLKESFIKTPETKTIVLKDEFKIKYDFAEFDLMRILIKYSTVVVNVDHLNDKNEIEKIETSVCELICHELHKDEFTFANPILSRIHRIISEGLAKNEFYKTSYFLRMEDQEIVKIISEIESDDVEISHNWFSKYNIDTNLEIDKIDYAVLSAVYSFKICKIEEKLRAIRSEIVRAEKEEEMDNLVIALSEQIKFEKIKRLFSEKLDRILY